MFPSVHIANLELNIVVIVSILLGAGRGAGGWVLDVSIGIICDGG